MVCNASFAGPLLAFVAKSSNRQSSAAHAP